MAEILKEWLTKRLQRPIKWEAEEFGDLMKNGYIISGVLRSYYVIDDEKYYLMRSSNNKEDIISNWNFLKKWLEDIEIQLSKSDLTNIMDGKGSALLRLFYQLFLHLDKRDRTNFIKQERKKASALVEKMGHRFTISKVEEENQSIVDDLSKPLLDEKQFINWQRKKEKEVKEIYDYIRHKYSKMLSKIEESNTPLQHPAPTPKKKADQQRKEMEQFEKRYPCKYHNYTYKELLNLESKAIERKRSIVNTEWAKDYMANLHSRMHNKSDSEEFQKQLRNVLSESLWDLSVAEEESKLDTELAKKVLKLSQFEKQMCTQIMETKQQAQSLVRNRVLGEVEFEDQRTQQFNQYLDNLREEIHLGIAEIDFEKQRQDMLHEKLFAEKMKRKRQHYYDICYDTVLSIIDYATKLAHFARLIENDIPEHFIHEWKTLFFTQQPIFDILSPMEDILKDEDINAETALEEEIIRLELDRQEALNESEFIEYHNYLPPWTLELLIPNYEGESKERKYEYLGSRILGHLIHTILEIKYPNPPQLPPAELPFFFAKAILRGLPDKSMVVAMQTILNYQKIHVVRLEAAINFCLRKFKTEMIGCTDIHLLYDKFIAAAHEEEAKDLIRIVKKEDESIYKNREANLTLLSTPQTLNTKQTQTPKTLPEEDISLSKAALLGRYAYESLNFGDTLTDHLLSAMIVEYIKDQEDINGFVIINYPNSYREAQILEETFTGHPPPDEGELDDRDDIYLEESIIKHRKKEKDLFKDFRVSRIAIDPHKKRLENSFTTYFTCYLKMKHSENILQESVIWNLTKDNSEFVDRFYAALGINYSMYYEVIEKDQLALICKYIIGDLDKPFKSYDELFGEKVLSALDLPSSNMKKSKSKIFKEEISKSKSKEKLSRSSKLGKVSNVFVVEALTSTESLEVVRDDELPLNMVEKDEYENPISTVVPSAESVKLLAGEDSWSYAEIPIPEIIGVALATCWEVIEKSYINDIKQLLFSKRLQMNCLIPYTRFIKDKMEQIIALPSEKQNLISCFQDEYNKFENDWRDAHSTKNEWHCRIKVLQDKLYKICDDRKLYADQQRRSLISDNWTMEELTIMVNTYISLMQAEINRFILTYQALHDFYFTMIKRAPPNDRLSSKELNKFSKETEETTGSRRSGEDKAYRQMSRVFQDLQLKNIQIDNTNNPFYNIIDNSRKLALKIIKDTNDTYRSLISREYGEIAKIIPHIKKKEENKSDVSINSEKHFKEHALKCIEEWTMGINGEMLRADLRLQAIQYQCYKDMKLFIDQIYRTFTDIQEFANTYYFNEVQSVDRLCKYLQMAVEGGKRIPETLILEQDAFIIDPNLIQFSGPEPEIHTGIVKEIVSDMEFKTSQLARLRKQFKIVAPTGIILKKALIYLLQDFIFFGKESCEGTRFPEAWKRVDPEQIPKLVYLLFGDDVYVDWRDFLIYAINLRFPNYDELLFLRKQFRCIDLESTETILKKDFIKQKLWFEQDFDLKNKNSEMRINLIKDFLFELFETAEYVFNYSAFLLAFCKSADVFEGFAMALSMAAGKKICFSIEECEEVVCKLIKEKKYRDECLAYAIQSAGLFLDKIITNVVNICEGTTIIELEYNKKAKKGKKGKSGPKAKKIEGTMNAKLPRLQKSVASNNSQRKGSKTTPSDVKTTYICPPCEVEETSEEKPCEKEEVEEQIIYEPQVDINLAYAVSQNVIWNVLNTCLPWQFQLIPEEKVTPYLEQVKLVMNRLEVDTDNKEIYVCKFLTDTNICKMIHKSKKFTALNLAEEIKKVMI